MKNLCVVCLFLLALLANAHTPDVNSFGSNNEVVDCIGIYYGTSHLRLKWTEDQWKPYVVHTFKNGERKWLFQGFCLLEQRIDNKSFIHTKKAEPATKIEWEKLISLLFTEGKMLDALDRIILKEKRELGNPPFRHKITVSIPIPIRGQTNWGKIDGKSMNFNYEKDRIKALKWYINEFLKEYAKHHYNNFDLAGFYWVEEDMEQTEGLAKQISDYLHSIGYKHYWTPYSTAKGSSYWDEYNFDYCYLQPGGYCINKERDFSRVEKALTKAKKRGTGVLFEFDSHIFSDPDTFVPRLNRCIDLFEQCDVYNKSSMSYYAGATIIYAISQGKYSNYKTTSKQLASIRDAMDRIAHHIVDRYTKRYGPPIDNLYPSNNPKSNNTDIEDWRNPDYWHF